MTYIVAESNRSRITCIMVVTESDWMRIQNLPNRIECGVKKTESTHHWCENATSVVTDIPAAKVALTHQT